MNFSPRKAQTVLYLTGALAEYEDLLSRLGPYQRGKGCLYLKQVDQVDTAALQQIARRSYRAAGRPAWESQLRIPHRARTHTHLKQESAFAARRLRVHNDSMVNEGEVMIVGYDHVQVAIPSGAEPVARDYYGGLLGMIESPKPAVLAARGGCWFTAGAAVLHLGVEADFAPPARHTRRSSWRTSMSLNERYD